MKQELRTIGTNKQKLENVTFSQGLGPGPEALLDWQPQIRFDEMGAHRNSNFAESE